MKPSRQLQANRQGKREGGSLVELLTVIAVISILAAILIPVTQSVRVSAHSTVCASNLRQIGLALHLYADDHDGLLPAISEIRTDGRSWSYSLTPYLSNADEVLISPGDPNAAKRLQRRVSSYVANEYLFSVQANPFGQVSESFRNLHALQFPQQTAAVFLGADHLTVSVFSDHAHGRSWNSWSAVINDIQPDRFRTGAATHDRTNGTANYLFADGHVQSIRGADLKARIEIGENIARPPEAE